MSWRAAGFYPLMYTNRCHLTLWVALHEESLAGGGGSDPEVSAGAISGGGFRGDDLCVLPAL